jgi:IclR family pca regulon transcriptional regulator
MSTDRNFINSLAKGLNFLMTFSKHRPRMNLTELAKANNMNLPTARRYLHTLAKQGFVVKDEATGAFQLTPKVLRLGSWVMETMGIRERLLPYMNSITRKYNVTTHCAILEGTEAVTVERLRSADVVNLDLTAGSRLPLHATSLGKSLLAWMPQKERDAVLDRLQFTAFTPHTLTSREAFEADLEITKERGYSIAEQELSLGLKTMAVPIAGPNGLTEASCGVSYPITRAVDPGLEEALIRELLELQDSTRGA